MQHPNILPVLDSGVENGITYLVTPYMENGAVGDHRSSYTDLNRALGLVQAIIPGLQAIYSAGYVHGNLRSTNIILDPQDHPLLADFAIAFQQGETPSPYNSPEQVQGGAIDQRTDVYALGVLLYSLLAGQEPAPGTVVNLQAVRPDVPQNVEKAILKATAQNPDQRFQTPAEFQSALANAMQPIPQPAASQAPVQKGTNWMGIGVGALLVIVFLLLAVIVGPQVVDYFNSSPQPNAEQPIQLPEQPAEQPEEQPPAQPPPDEAPPADQPSAPERPDSGEEASSGSTLPVCNSVGLVGGIVLMGGVISIKRRRRA
jgi:serine/threonine protein kinase